MRIITVSPEQDTTMDILQLGGLLFGYIQYCVAVQSILSWLFTTDSLSKRSATMARTTNAVVMSLGSVNMWGFSPGYDAQQVSTHPAISDQATEPLNVLLIGPGDIRHALHTIASRRRHGGGTRPIHIYIYESSVETLARHLLLLQIAQDWELPLRQRCNTFLEVFGNALVQERTSQYIETKAKALVELLHYERGWLAEQIDLSHLKMKTRDELVDTFQSWHRNVRFDMVKLRDHRLRHYYELRYDYRNNLIDWDYTMTLRKIEQARVIHLKQFREWRNSGIAFEFGDQQYTEPNRTMAAYTEARKKNHGAVMCRGVWTDIVIGPYVSFGVQCDTPNKFAKQLFEIHNKGTGVEQNRHNTTEVAVYNVLSFLYEIETGQVYRMTKAHDVYSGIGDSELEKTSNQQDSEQLSRVEEIVEDEEKHASSATLTAARERDAHARAKTIVESFEGIKIIPLTGRLEDVFAKKRYHQCFDHVFMSSQHSHILQKHTTESPPLFTDILSSRATVVVESPTFLLPLSEDQRVLYMTKLLEMAQNHNFVAAKPFNTSVGVSKDLLTKVEHAVVAFSFSRD